MEKEKVFYLSYYNYEEFKRSIEKILENKNPWDELGDDRKRLNKIEIVIRKSERID